MYGIHHPRGDLKKISRGTVVNEDARYRDSELRAVEVRWSPMLGFTETGSSGSGLFDSRGSLRGVLRGSNSKGCSQIDDSSYGRFDLFYPRIERWLDPSSGGGGSGQPDLVVASIEIDELDYTLTPGEIFAMWATVRNQGNAKSDRTTLRYYRSSDRVISRDDREGPEVSRVGELDPSETSRESRFIRAPTAPGTYYYGACIDTVPGESNTRNNCSTGVRVVVRNEPTDDHGNTRGRASQVNLNRTARGALERSGDVDYFRVVVTRTGTLTVKTEGPTDTVGELQRANGTKLDEDDDDGTGNNFQIRQQVSAGTYYVKVSGFRSATGSYTLHVQFTPSGGGPGTPTTDDHPDRREDVRRTTRLNTATRGVLERSGDVDYFRVEVTQTGQLRIATSGSTDADGNLQTSRTVLAGDNDAGEGTNFRIVRQVPRGTYYIAVFGGRGRTATGAYTLHVSFTPAGGGGGPSDIREHGDSRGQATVVRLDATLPVNVRGALERRGDRDYFRVIVPATGELRVATSGDTDTYGYLGGTSGPWLSRNDDNRGNRNFRLVRRVSRGTYYVAVVGGEDRTATGEYTLHVNFSRQ